MTDYNMPPGCRISDIPGIYADDDDREELIGKLKSEREYSRDLELQLDAVRHELRGLIEEIDRLIGKEKGE